MTIDQQASKFFQFIRLDYSNNYFFSICYDLEQLNIIIYPIENDIAEKIETFITNLLNGNIKDFYPAIVITDEMDDGYNIYFIKIDFLN